LQIPKITGLLQLSLASLSAREFHIAITGDDAANGSSARPLRTIQAAANQAMPGDSTTVHEGIYPSVSIPARR
jgi:hypothetical protein